MSATGGDAGRYGCRWCPVRHVYFKDLEEHANDEHPVEYERAITRANLEVVGRKRRRRADPRRAGDGMGGGEP